MERVLAGNWPAWLALGALAAGCWWLTGRMAVDFTGSASAAAAWDSAGFAALFAMWAVMMAAMMLPSFAPALRIFAKMTGAPGARRPRQHLAFAGGYLLLWLAFSVAAALLQLAGAAAGLLNAATMAVASPYLAAALLAAAGAFQFAPLKMRCLRGCRHPVFFFLLHWRGGAARAAAMLGMRYGLLCVGCCGFLMLLLFAGGIMNLACIAALTAYVLLEKTLPATLLPSEGLARLTGAALLLAAGGLLIWHS